MVTLHPPPPTGADLHGERRGGAAAVEAHRQPGDSNQRAGGLELPTGKAKEPDGQPALHRVPSSIHIFNCYINGYVIVKFSLCSSAENDDNNNNNKNNNICNYS